MEGRAVSILEKLVSEFINRESNRTSLITVTKVELGGRGKDVTVFISAFPESGAQGAVAFLNRNRDELKTFLKKNSKLAIIPRFQFLIDPSMGSTPREIESGE